MMPSIHEYTNNFLIKLTDVADQLNSFRQEIHDRPERAISAIKNVISAAMAPTPGHGASPSPLAKAVENSIENTRNRLVRWEKALEERIRSREFIDKFDRSLIVLIYGKVNSGKSTLGNFIAGLDFTGIEGNPYIGRELQFVEHASSGLSNRIDRLTEINPDKGAQIGFATKSTECTSSIQEFTIAGLSWIDCPGVHAVTKENEALAREYADNAELIIYITSADAAMRRSDHDELLRFARQGKPVLLVVSKFDIMEEVDFLEDGTAVTVCLPKTPESRQQIQSWLEDQINGSDVAEVLQNRHYSFVSTRLAARALKEGNAELFEQSGIPDLYHQLASVMTEQAVDLKTRNPKMRFNALIGQILGQIREDAGEQAETDTIASLRQRFANDVTSLRRAQAELMALVRPAATRIRYKAEPGIMDQLRQMAEAADADQSTEAGSRNAIAAILQQHTREVLADEISRVLEGYNQHRLQNFSGFRDFEVPSIEAVYDTIEVSQKTIYAGTGKAIGGGLGGGVGAWKGASAGFALGGPVGALIGGLAGGLAGSFVGSAAGAGIGEGMAGTKSVTVKVGNNLQNVVKHVLDQIEARLPDEIDRIVDSVSNDYLRPLETTSTAMIVSLDRLEGTLADLRYPV